MDRLPDVEESPGSQGAHTHVILVLHECIWNAPAVLLVLPAFDDTGSLDSLPRRLVFPRGSTLGDCLLFHCRK